MAKRSQSKKRDSESSVKKSPTFTEVQAIFSAKLKYIGEVTKTEYVWSKGGDVRLVDDRDVPALLLKKAGNSSCCGNNSGGNYLFSVKE